MKSTGVDVSYASVKLFGLVVLRDGEADANL